MNNSEKEDQMTSRELRRLNRKDLLQMLIEQSQEVQSLRKKLAEAETALANKTIAINQAGSIAEASLQLSGIFQAAQDACQLYLDNVNQSCQRQADMERDTEVKCAEMLREAKEQSQQYWDEVSEKLEKFCEDHAALRELLSMIPPPRKQD
jgi:hypothetical protein